MNFETGFKYPNYTDEEHETWALLYKKQKELLPNRACQEFLDGLDKLNFSPTKIPHLGDVSKILYDCTKWKLTRVEGLVPEKEFFEMLSQRLFPSTDFIRKREELNYTPAPDMFHDLFGHTSLITNQDFADFFQLMGQAATRADEQRLKEIQRFYWFTVEFGLIYNNGKKRIYGSGILSSPGEVVYCLSDDVHVHEFSTNQVTHQDFDIWHMQGELFIIKSFSQLKDEFYKYGHKNKLLN
ncbi:MAG: phenylalanine 4-monooxygenase [Oligoflexia bacterium]|nr:phenylalanine 4-monooxygenase [Oligoflexia bacterium]